MLDLYRNIKMLREEKGMSQDELAKLCGYTSRSSIAKIEKGEVDIQNSKILLFANALGTTPGKLMGLTEFDSKEPTTIAAHFEGDDFTEEEMDDIRAYAEFVKNRRNKKQELTSLTEAEKLEQEAYEQHVPVDYIKFRSERINGLYVDGSIAIRTGMTSAQTADTLAEELAHHYTTTGNILNQKIFLIVSKNELPDYQRMIVVLVYLVLLEATKRNAGTDTNYLNFQMYQKNSLQKPWNAIVKNTDAL